ncbi:MAG TPA: hypothetical protein VF824_15865 [Thermoanaerobaculia bacterium]|jgi:hypothetical protein
MSRDERLMVGQAEKLRRGELTSGEAATAIAHFERCAACRVSWERVGGSRSPLDEPLQLP